MKQLTRKSALSFWSWLGRVLLAGVIFLVGALIFHKSLNYYSPDFQRGYLAGKGYIWDGIFKYGLYAHIVTAPFVLLISTIQVLFRYETRLSTVHKTAGKIYCLLVLILAAPGGLVMSFYAIGGVWAKANFILLSSLWWVVTFMAWRFARKRDFTRHRNFMIRSFILALSAVNLRILSFVFVYFFDWQGLEMYTTAAWLSWVPFLLAFEMLILLGKKNGRSAIPPHE